MNALAEVGLWLALAGAAWSTGVRLARWDRAVVGPSPPHRLDAESGVVVVTAALLVMAWGVLAGALLRRDASLALALEGIPVVAPRWQGLGALWGTMRGGVLTLAALIALAAVSAGTTAHGPRARATSRLVGVLSGLALVLLVVSLVLLPPLAPAAAARAPASMPLYLVELPALLAPLAALGAVTAALVAAALLVAARGAADGEAAVFAFRRVVLAAWLLATLAIAAEQAARTRLGIGVEDPVVLGSSRSGLALWLALGVLAHGRVRDWLLTGGQRARRRRWMTHAVHAGAALVVLSFALHIVARRTTTELPPGAAVEVRDGYGRTWTLVNQGLSRFDAEGRDIAALAIQVTRPGGAARLLTAEHRQYFDRGGLPLGTPLGLRATWRSPLQDARLVLDSALAGEVARVRVSFVPLAALWTLGTVLMLLGGGAAFTAPDESHAAETG
jgi:cytochrome c biogenesis factor